MLQIINMLERFQLVWRSLWWIPRGSTAGEASIQVKQPLLLAIFPILVVWYLARPTEVAVVVTVWFAGLLAVCYFWVRQLAVHLSAKRTLQYSAVQVGDEIEELVNFSNASFVPVLWAEFTDFSNIPGHNLTSVRALDGLTSSEWRVHAVCSQRGNYHFGPWQLISSDPFGIFQVTITYHQQEEILVYPPLAELPDQLLTRGRIQGDDRLLPLPLYAESLSVLHARPYQSGDPFRRIHWPSTAKRGAPFVKVFDPEASSVLWIIPDFDSAAHTGSGNQSSLETLVILAASLTQRFLDSQMSVGIIAYTHSPQVILPSRGQAQFWNILRLLAGLQAVPRPFAETLSQARNLITGRERLILITPSLQPEWLAPLARLGSSASRSGAEIILLNPASFSSGDRNPMERTPRKEVMAFASFLASLGNPAQILDYQDIRPYTASYGELSRWEFQTLGTGRAYARHTPRTRINPVQPL